MLLVLFLPSLIWHCWLGIWNSGPQHWSDYKSGWWHCCCKM